MIFKKAALRSLLIAAALATVSAAQDAGEYQAAKGKWYTGTVAADGKVITKGTGGWKVASVGKGVYLIQLGKEKKLSFEEFNKYRQSPRDFKLKEVVMNATIHGELETGNGYVITTSSTTSVRNETAYVYGVINIAYTEDRTFGEGKNRPFSFVAYVED